MITLIAYSVYNSELYQFIQSLFIILMIICYYRYLIHFIFFCIVNYHLY